MIKKRHNNGQKRGARIKGYICPLNRETLTEQNRRKDACARAQTLALILDKENGRVFDDQKVENLVVRKLTKSLSNYSFIFARDDGATDCGVVIFHK